MVKRKSKKIVKGGSPYGEIGAHKLIIQYPLLGQAEASYNDETLFEDTFRAAYTQLNNSAKERGIEFISWEDIYRYDLVAYHGIQCVFKVINPPDKYETRSIDVLKPVGVNEDFIFQLEPSPNNGNNYGGGMNKEYIQLRKGGSPYGDIGAYKLIIEYPLLGKAEASYNDKSLFEDTFRTAYTQLNNRAKQRKIDFISWEDIYRYDLVAYDDDGIQPVFNVINPPDHYETRSIVVLKPRGVNEDFIFQLKECPYPNNYGGGMNKEYIQLQKGGKRLVRYGPKGGKYYMKGGKKNYIK